MGLITDICEISDEKEIISCLRERFMQDIIYTYVAKVLIAVNPYRHINGLYAREKMDEYRNDFKDELPPHLFSIANKILLDISLNPQSVILTGETGSGKTRSAMHLLSFISKSSKVADRAMATNHIFELFGNARTSHNKNSSRYTKLTEILLHPDYTLATVQMSYVLLESGRIYAQNETESNFHIFYALLTLSAKKLLKDVIDLHLDDENYDYLADYHHHADSYTFQDFGAVDKALIEVGLTNEERIQIYKIVAAILHLGNVQFEENSLMEGCRVADNTTDHLSYAAQLLGIEEKRIEMSLLTRKMEISGSDPIVIQLDQSRALKVKNSLSQALYESVFQYIVDIVNRNGLDASSSASSAFLRTNLLDIAGFESFDKGNHFEQLCINFINEKVQQMFIKLMLKSEQEWYASENVEIPEIPFLDNYPILDLYENKMKGIFKVLDDTGKMQCQTNLLFLQNIILNWKNNQILAKPKPQKVQVSDGFIIRHYVGDVFYNVNNFVEKNCNVLTKETKKICHEAFPNNGSDDGLNGKSTAFMLKSGTDELIRKLQGTKCSFVRCIKPNSIQCSGMFDESVVKPQLVSSGSIAYQKLMRVGFPSHLSIAELYNMFKDNVEFETYISNSNPKDFCNLLVRTCGLKWQHFKLGNTQIFFRSGKLELLSEKLKEDPKIIKQRIDKRLKLRKKFKLAILVARICVKGRCRFNEMQELCGKCGSTEMQEVEEFREQIPKKKIRLSKSTQIKTAVSPGISNTNRSTTFSRKSITVHSNENSLIENQLRILLQQEQKKNEQLSIEYRELQKRNVQLLTEMEDLKKENKMLKNCNFSA